MVGGFLEGLPGSVCAEIAANRIEPGNYSSDVSIQHGVFFLIGDAEDCGGGVGADAGKSKRVCRVVWENAVVLRDDQLRGYLQVAGARVVAETRPQAEDVFFRGGCQRFDVGEAFEEAFVIGNGGCYARLLQHDFGEPDAVGGAGLAPGQFALELGEPSEKIIAEAGERGASEHVWISFAQEGGGGLGGANRPATGRREGRAPPLQKRVGRYAGDQEERSLAKTM